MHPEEYRKMAETEDRMWYYRALHRNVRLALAGLAPDSRLLDAGCGTGGLLRHLGEHEPGWALTGLDFSPLACELARTRARAGIVEGSVLALPFPAGAFEAIVSCDVVCQVDQPAIALREFWRCLRPGGRLVLTMPAYAWMYSYHDRQVGNLRRYGRGELLALVRGAGFRLCGDTFWNMLPFPLAVVRRKLLPAGEGHSDVRLYPAPLEATFNAMMEFEHAWLRDGNRLPWGSTLMVSGVKPCEP